MPHKYDFLNRLLTLGMDQKWRKIATEICLSSKPKRVMDLCSGTGDLAIELAKRASEDTQLVSADFCEPMLELARRKADKTGLGNKIIFQVADAAELPFDDYYFDVIGIAFGFRNLTFKNPKTDLYLREIFRVIAPGGKLVIVETSQPRSYILKRLTHLYLSSFAAPVGNAISRQSGAYSYLAYSARNFYDPAQVCELLSKVGFDPIDFTLYWQGITAIHVAEVPS
ncbi:MAG: ubiquinone/menaquinone biosynthesis methyltransferase [candidate division Zixibacteria bacterium]|nr:ubiquinone/menaquinone biosynthesis methyltransferase [candidate division Zixibacteria bacterium]